LAEIGLDVEEANDLMGAGLKLRVMRRELVVWRYLNIE
jgi:hypothetical protein